MLLQLPHQGLRGLVAGLQHHEGLDDQPADRIRGAHDGGFGHRRVFQECALHLKGADAVPRGLDDIIVPSDEPVVAIFVHGCQVIGIVPSPPEGLPVRLLVLQVPGEEPDGPGIGGDGNPTFAVDADRVPVPVMELDAPARGRLSHGTGPGLHAREDTDAEHGLGLSIPLKYVKAGVPLPDPDHLRIQGFPGAQAPAEVGKGKASEVLQDQHPVHSGWCAEGGDGVAL